VVHVPVTDSATATGVGVWHKERGGVQRRGVQCGALDGGVIFEPYLEGQAAHGSGQHVWRAQACHESVLFTAAGHVRLRPTAQSLRPVCWSCLLALGLCSVAEAGQDLELALSALYQPQRASNLTPVTPPPSAPPSSVLMNSMNARFKNLVGSKRRSASNNASPSPQGNSAPAQRPNSLSPQPSNNSTNSLPPPAGPGQQQQSNMNPNNPLGRPPSYTYAPPGGLQPGQQAQGRPNSPLPPINTGGAPGYPPQHGQPMGYPPQAGPPGYPPQQGYGGAPPPGQQQQQQYGAPAPPSQQLQYRPGGGMAEVAGEGRSKAQLIVGIDFVSFSLPCMHGR
jgi:hypothetical protein